MLEPYVWVKDGLKEHILQKVDGPTEELRLGTETFDFSKYEFGDVFQVDYMTDKLFRLIFPEKHYEA